MTIIELREKKISLQDELSNLVNESEKRELAEDETSHLAEIRSQIDEVEKEIAEEEKRNAEIAKENKVEKKPTKRMKLINLINTVAEGRSFDEDTAKELAEVRAEMRDAGLATNGQIQVRTINVSTEGQGQENVPEDKKNIELALRNALVATKMGCTWLGGCKGDISIPTYAGSNVAWKGETAAAVSGDSTWGEVILKPHRLTAYLNVSKTFLAQDTNDAEGMLIKDLANAIAEKLDQTIFGNQSGTTDIPQGVFNAVSAATGTSLASVAYANVLNLESDIEQKNGSEYMFVVNPKVKFTYKGTQRGKGLGMVYEGNEMDGYKTISSQAVVDKGILCLDPKTLVVAQWGGLDMTIDPYTLAADNQIKIVVNAYFDFKLKNNRAVAEIYS